MLVVGIDPSLTGFAICWYWPETGKSAGVRLSSPPCGQGLKQRLARYARFIQDIGSAMAMHEDGTIFLEGYSYASKGSVITLAEFGGLLRDWLTSRWEVHEVAPNALKKFATGKGAGKGTDKLAVCLAIQRRYGISLATNDEFDAYGIARLGACFLGAENPQTAAQAEVVAAMRGEKPCKGSPKKRKSKSAGPSSNEARRSPEQPGLFR